MATKTPTPPFAESTMPKPSKALTNAQKRGKEAFDNIAFGSIGGVTGKIVEYPFDTVKVRLQSQPDHLPLRYKGPLDCFRQSIAQDGIRGLYRGVSAPLAGAAAENASLFYSYELAQNFLMSQYHVQDKKDLSLKAKIVAGTMSGAVTAFVLTPIELVKCRMQVPLQSSVDRTLGPSSGLTTSKSLSPFTVVADVFRREGFFGFWRGHLGTFIRESGGTAAWFRAWEGTTLAFQKRLARQRDISSPKVTRDLDLPLWQQLTAGAMGGMSYNLILYPADTIKSKIQTGELVGSGGRQPTFVGVGKQIWRTHGLRGLYRGCALTVARSAPSSALTFTIVENCKHRFA